MNAKTTQNIGAVIFWTCVAAGTILVHIFGMNK